MTQEEKAKAYDKALESAIIAYKDEDRHLKATLERIFPELKESEDEKIREAAKYGLQHLGWEHINGIKIKDILAWLEKQGNIDKESHEIAEKEKYDFVSGQFIECRKSFNEFKENNSYWLEYVGNDTYIGRSDNILNKKFHITPRQLYRLFTHEHCPKEDSNVNNEANAPTGYGKYVDECLNEASKHFFSEGEDKYSVADLFYAGVRCGKSWLEKQSEQKSTWDKEDDVMIYKLLAVVELYYDRDGDDLDKQSCIDWLKSLKQRQTVEWEPKDQGRYEDIRDVLRCCMNLDTFTQSAIEADLKWFVERYSNMKQKNYWKPSDEQMTDLWNMLCECRPADHQLLQDIYYGLKKLKEE